MTVIVEGPDGAGKTTLAKALAEEFELEYHHEGPPQTTDVFGHYLHLVMQPNVVLDRLALGELVYGPLLRGWSRMSRVDYDAFKSVCRALDRRTIICLPSYETCYASWKEKDEHIKDEGLFRATYMKWCEMRIEGDLIYDWTTDININWKEWGLV